MSIYVLPSIPRSLPQIGALQMDAFITEEHVFETAVAEHPTEKGYPISDNVVQKPIELSLEVVVSPSPVQSMVPTSLSRADDMYKKLRGLQKGGYQVSVVTGLTKYRNMIITNVTIPRSKDTSQVLRFTVNLKEIRVSNTSKVTTEPVLGAPEVVKTDFVDANFQLPTGDSIYQPNGFFGGSTGSGTRVDTDELIETPESVEKSGNAVTRFLEDLRGEPERPY